MAIFGNTLWSSNKLVKGVSMLHVSRQRFLLDVFDFRKSHATGRVEDWDWMFS